MFPFFLPLYVVNLENKYHSFETLVYFYGFFLHILSNHSLIYMFTVRLFMYCAINVCINRSCYFKNSQMYIDRDGFCFIVDILKFV